MPTEPTRPVTPTPASAAARLPLARLACADAAPSTRPVATDADRAAWLARVDAWQAAFATVPGRSVALFMDDGYEFSAALFAAWRCARTPWLPGDRLPATLARLASQVDAFAGDFDGAVPGPHVVAAVHATADSDAAPEPAAAAAPPPMPAPALDPEACAIMLFTSGSTGEPVAIRKSLRQLDAEVDVLERAFGATLGQAQVHGTVSHQHIYGLLFRILWPLSAGRAFARQRRHYTEELTALGDDPLVLVASPAHLKRLPDTQDWRRFGAGLRAVFSSGGPLPADAAADVRRLWGRAAIEVFGSTETGGIAWRQAGGAAAPWSPLPGVQWRLQDGRLQVRSPHLAQAAWFATEDRAVATGGDGFALRGRADRIVKIEERRIALGAIERRLLASGLLCEARVVVLPGPRALLAVAAVASAEGERRLASAGRAGLGAALREFLAGHVEPIALPRRWRFLPALPVDAQGKCSERALLALFQPRMPEPHWHRRTPELAELELDVDPALAAFVGHFPQASILPGVVLVDWAVRLAGQAFATGAVELQRMDALKFQHVVRPGMRLRLRLERLPDGLGFRFESDHGLHASGRLRLAGGGAP